MQNGKQIVCEFLLWTQRLVIHDNEFALMHRTQVLNKPKPKPDQTILVSNDQGADITSNDVVHQREKLFSLEVQTTADFFDPLIDDKTTSDAELLKVLPLIEKIGLLCRTGNTTIDHTPLLFCGFFQPKHNGEIFIGIVALIRDRAMCLESAFSVPSLQGLGNNPYQFCKLAYRVHVRSIVHMYTQFQLSSATPCRLFMFMAL